MPITTTKQIILKSKVIIQKDYSSVPFILFARMIYIDIHSIKILVFCAKFQIISKKNFRKLHYKFK